jgi:hypothetical protein
MTNQIRTIQIEYLRPGVFNIPKDVSVAVIKRDIYNSDTCKFYYSTGLYQFKDSIKECYDYRDVVFNDPARYLEFNTPVKRTFLFEMKTDTSIRYPNLSDTCVNALVNYFRKNVYFRNVYRTGDSLTNILKIPGNISTKEELFEKTKSDMCLFLDFMHLKTTYNRNELTPFITKASLLWTIAFKTDSLVYTYHQTDTLFYEQDLVSAGGKDKDKILRQLVNSSSIYLGSSFGAKMIPNWMPTERMYYKSKNTEMLKAEKYAISQDWLKAAEIWNQQTKNKNDKIAAKACYNMALACEMEGKPDVAIAWLVKSYSSLKKNNEDHKTNCQRYVNILAIRKLEIERLEEQVNIQDLSNKTEN